MPNAVDVVAIATALGITKRAVTKRAEKDAWPFEERIARGGPKRFYLVSRLPVSIQAALAAKVIAAAPPVINALPPSSQYAGEIGRAHV